MTKPSMWFPLETFQWTWFFLYKKTTTLQVFPCYLKFWTEETGALLSLDSYSLTDETFHFFLWSNTSLMSIALYPCCCRLSLQTSTCFQRTEQAAVGSGKPACCGTRRRGAPGSSPRRSGTRCARWTPTAGLGWRQAPELIRKSIKKTPTPKKKIPCVHFSLMMQFIAAKLLKCWHALCSALPWFLQGRFVRSPSLLRQALEEET
jgi:hypothetical protein